MTSSGGMLSFNNSCERRSLIRSAVYSANHTDILKGAEPYEVR